MVESGHNYHGTAGAAFTRRVAGTAGGGGGGGPLLALPSSFAPTLKGEAGQGASCHFQLCYVM